METMKLILAFAGTTILLFSSSVLAADAPTAESSAPTQEKQEKAAAPEEAASFPYSPGYCEFSAAFSAEPYIEHRCEGEDGDKCYELVSYTKVYDMATTVNVRVICSAIDPEVYKTYSAQIMEKTLRAMTDQNVVKTFDTSFREEDGYKQAGLVGEGQVGRLSTIYIAQLWIGKGSAFSVEAEMIGEKNDDADAMFSDVLKSVRYVGEKEETGDKKEDDQQEQKKESKKTEPEKNE